MPISVKPVKIDNTKDIRLNTVYYKIKKLQEIIDGINIEAKKLVQVGIPNELGTEQWLKIEECPLEILDRHCELSQILVGVGCYEWNCPFCNKRFQE